MAFRESHNRFQFTNDLQIYISQKLEESVSKNIDEEKSSLRVNFKKCLMHYTCQK